MLTFGSTFAGIGGFDRALEAGGMRCAWQVEMDDDCNRVLARHFPGVPRHRDIREVTADELRRVDVLTGGVPCQDWSVAGKRAGLAGKRSGLFFDFARLADTLAPAWVLFENVPGLLSSGPECGCERCEKDRAFALRYKTSEKRSREVEAAWRRIQRHKQALIGEDFATVLECLTGFRPTVPEGGWRNSGVCVGHKRGAAWRVLDAQYFGVAQRRRRVFLVASPGDGSGPVQVLFEPESCDGDSPPRRQARAEIAGTLEGGTKGRGWSDDFDRSGAFIPSVAAFGGNRTSGSIDVATACNAHGGTGRHDFESETFVVGSIQAHNKRHGHAMTTQQAVEAGHLVAHTLKAGGADASEDGTGRGVPLAVVTTAFNWQSGGDCRLNPKENLTDALSVGQVPSVAAPIRGNIWNNSDPGMEARMHIQQGMVVRRLTPTECERLQGFPDGWTAHDADGKPVSDSARYRMLGNAVAVPVVQWIGERIIEAHRLTGV